MWVCIFLTSVSVSNHIAVIATMSSLERFAIDAVSMHPNSNIEQAIEFSSKACPAFVSQDNDRLVKVGRSLESLISLKDKIPLEESLRLLVDECNLLCSGAVKVFHRAMRVVFIVYATSLQLLSSFRIAGP